MTIDHFVHLKFKVGDGDKFPPILLQFEKRTYNFTLHVTKENVSGGSNVYTAVKVSANEEVSPMMILNKQTLSR